MPPMNATGASRLLIDWTRCDGHAACVELLPELLAEDEWGYPLVRDSRGRGPAGVEVPEELVEHAGRAVKVCPALALRLLSGSTQPR